MHMNTIHMYTCFHYTVVTKSSKTTNFRAYFVFAFIGKPTHQHVYLYSIGNFFRWVKKPMNQPTLKFISLMACLYVD